MNDCALCKHAIFDYEEYYGTNQREYFVSDCKLGYSCAEECGEDYEERRDE